MVVYMLKQNIYFECLYIVLKACNYDVSHDVTYGKLCSSVVM